MKVNNGTAGQYIFFACNCYTVLVQCTSCVVCNGEKNEITLQGSRNIVIGICNEQFAVGVRSIG